MKKKIPFLVLSLILSIGIQAQSDLWFEIGATFRYNVFDPWTHGYQELVVDRDTLIDSEKWFVLTNHVQIINFGNFYEYYSDDEIIVRNLEDQILLMRGDHTTDLLYDFNLSTGDTLRYSGFDPNNVACEYSNNYILDSLQEEFIAGKNRMVQYFTVQDSSFFPISNDVYEFPVQFVEGIGNVSGAFFPSNNHHCAWDQQGYLFCAFEEDGFEYENNAACDLVSHTVDVESEPFVVYPTVFSHRFTFRNKVPELITAFGMDGQYLSLHNENNYYSISQNYSGLVILHIYDGKDLTVLKLLKI